MDIAYIYRERLVIQDEDFLQEFFTQVFSEMLWDDCDKAKLVLLHRNIVAMFNEGERFEKDLFYLCG